MSLHHEAMLPGRQRATFGAQRETVCALDGGRLALDDMALAARPSAEPRTACPVCGGPIHPIAGKCKHCKTDLVKLRKQQMQAAGTPAPQRHPYGGATQARPATAPVVPINGSASGPLAAHGAAPSPVIISAPVAAADPYQMSVPPVRRGAWSRSWPIVVAVIAAAAIVVSVILLLTADPEHKGSSQKVVPPPAPDRMNTDPLQPSDPWQGAQPGSGNVAPSPPPNLPSPPGGPGAPSVPAPMTPPPAPTAAAVPPPEKWSTAIFEAACTRMSTCGVLDSSARRICDELTSAAAFADSDMKDKIARGDCTYDRDRAATCLGSIDSIPCAPGGGGGGQPSLDVNDLSRAVASIAACADVLECH
jgi:hypothetical protein